MTQEQENLQIKYACLEDNEWTPIRHHLLDPQHPLVQKLDQRQRALPAPPGSDEEKQFVLSLGAVAPAAYQQIHDTARMAFHMTGCSGDPVCPVPQDAVAAAMCAQAADPHAETPISFFYHLGDIAYKADADDPPLPGTGIDDCPPSKDKMAARIAAVPDQAALYNQEFYQAYRSYAAPIFAIAGNHDGKYKQKKDADPPQLVLKQSAMWHFLNNFCAPVSGPSPDDTGLPAVNNVAAQPPAGRPTITQPYPFWILDTPVLSIIGLYANVVNGGMLDDPALLKDPAMLSKYGSEVYKGGLQYQWLTNRLMSLKNTNEKRLQDRLRRKPILLAIHYPPYSASVNFVLRGDPSLWLPPEDQEQNGVHYENAAPLAVVLQEAFRDAQQRPDLIISAHAHLYQRLTYIYKDGQQLPCLIVGSGGHAPLEMMGHDCAQADPRPKKFGTVSYDRMDRGHDVPADLLPKGVGSQISSSGDRLRLDAYFDGQKDGHPAPHHFGFIRITVDNGAISGSFFDIGSAGKPKDSFTLEFRDEAKDNKVSP